MALLWFFYPNPSQDLRTAEGVPVPHKGGGRIISTTFQVDSIVMSCAPDMLGPMNICSRQFLQGVPAKATYFHMRSLMSMLGGSSGAAILVRLEQDGKTVMVHTDFELVKKIYVEGTITNFFSYPFLRLILAVEIF